MKKILLSLFLLLICVYAGFVGYNYISKKKLEISEQKELIKQYNKIIAGISIPSLELEVKKNLDDLKTIKKKIKLDDGLLLTKHEFVNGFYSGIHETYPGSGYLDFHNNNLFVISARGILAHTDLSGDKSNFKQIKNNIGDFINLKQFDKMKWFSIKDLKIHDNKIFVSFTEEIEEDCWNTSIIYSEIDYREIKFQKLFSPSECVHSKENEDKEFNAHQSGGRIDFYNNDEIFFTIGDYRSRGLAQDKKSLNGKIIKFNIKSRSYKIISMGHRNPQGLFYDNDNNFILESEHGPQGGDEINLIHLNKNEIPNFGWAIASYGEHYGGKKESNKLKYQKYPLLKSHENNNFIEPIKYFVPSIGTSEIVGLTNKSYVLSSTKDKAIYFFNLNSSNELENLSRIKVTERVRDMIYKDNKLFLFLENTASVGIIELN
tara:strand:+ start:563 stop:1858 length:1296 start_codon:yes stop_codon:yes gene_type:complete